jgi:hypothetical protein
MKSCDLRGKQSPETARAGHAAHDAFQRTRPEATPREQEAWLLQERYGPAVDTGRQYPGWGHCSSGLGMRQVCQVINLR